MKYHYHKKKKGKKKICCEICKKEILFGTPLIRQGVRTFHKPCFIQYICKKIDLYNATLVELRDGI